MLVDIVSYIAVVGLVATLAIVAATLLQARSRFMNTESDEATRGVPWVLWILFCWAVGFSLLASLGFFYAGAKAPPVGLGLAVLVPFATGVALLLAPGPVRSMMERLPKDWLIRIQSYRAEGAIFVILWALGRLPVHFALSAGLGDLAIGISAPFVAAVVARNTPNSRLAARIWNFLGVADLVSALILGIGSSGSAASFIPDTPSSSALGMFPLAVIPTILVPLSLVLHVASLRSIGRQREVDLPTGATASA